MELWIRSQNKESLTKVSNVVYTYKKGDLYTDVRGKHNIGTYYDNLELLGTYETKERALEVLDEIQNILNPMIVFEHCDCTKDMLDKIKEVGACVVSDNSHIEQLSTCVYEMPNE